MPKRLILCYFDGLSRDEAAEKLSCSLRTLMRRLEKARERLRRRLERRGVATVGLGVAVLSSGELSASVSNSTAAAAIAACTGGPVSASVQALAGTGAALYLFSAAVGLMLLLAGGGLGLTVLAMRTAPDEQAVLSSPLTARNPDERNPQAWEKSGSLDADGQALPAGAIRRLGSRKYRIEGSCGFLLPTPDGRHVLAQPQPAISGSAAQGLMLVDLDTGLRVRAFEDSRRVPKNQSLEANYQAAFSLDGKKLYGLGWHKSEKDGDGFAQWASFDNPSKRVLLVWEVATGKLLSEWDLPGGSRGEDISALSSLLGVNVSPDGKRLYVYGAIRMSSIPGQFVRGLPGLHVLDAATGKKLRTWEGAGCPVGTIAGEKEIITFRKGAEITAHDVQTGKPVRTFPLDGYVASVGLSADGRTVAATGITEETGQRTCTLKIWEAASARELRRPTVDVAAIGFGARLAFSADGKTLYLGGKSGRILRWDVATGRALPEWSAHSGMLADLFHRRGKNEIVSAGRSDGAIRRWDAATGKSLANTNAYVGDVAVARTPDGTGIVSVDAAGRLDVWDVETGGIRKTLRIPGRNRHEMLFTPDGQHLLVLVRGSCRCPKTVAAERSLTGSPPLVDRDRR